MIKGEQIPDVLALEVEEALSLCHLLGWQVQVQTTAPPRGNPRGPQRVVRFTVIAPRKGVLTVAREETGKEV
ncbi:hypothetical protein Desku_2558 [Desulfofundulus kuznetsovii DSM 6115]|jgi:hypothetical protein|uniref:PASTA domain-containing protein n=1 Tax=Desulfofundulus kuznetsovii (strain DSM 6115 / VKM B-1805 / 17) TaxID=760568 RepID=A0AAU8PDG9_DESK7|nr:hypothetical protein Desku_2558 [Desulfofundulus kuznetsovii DSM 6115]